MGAQTTIRIPGENEYDMRAKSPGYLRATLDPQDGLSHPAIVVQLVPSWILKKHGKPVYPPPIPKNNKPLPLHGVFIS